MNMKINGNVSYSATDGEIYEMEAYLPEKGLYVIVQVCDPYWSYAVSHQSMEVYSRDIVECFDDANEAAESEYADIYSMLMDMIDVMKFAKIAQK